MAMSWRAARARLSSSRLTDVITGFRQVQPEFLRDPGAGRLGGELFRIDAVDGDEDIAFGKPCNF